MDPAPWADGRRGKGGARAQCSDFATSRILRHDSGTEQMDDRHGGPARRRERWEIPRSAGFRIEGFINRQFSRRQYAAIRTSRQQRGGVASC